MLEEKWPDDQLFCPNCNIPLEIDQMNCKIFRCAAASTWINPHASLEEIKKLCDENVLFAGCGAPLIFNEATEKIEISKDKDGKWLYI